LSAYRLAWAYLLGLGCHPALWVYPLGLAYRLVRWAYPLAWAMLLLEASLWASKALEYQLALLAAALGLPSALAGSSGWGRAALFPVAG
jgi:hypothetical protein